MHIESLFNDLSVLGLKAIYPSGTAHPSHQSSHEVLGGFVAPGRSGGYLVRYCSVDQEKLVEVLRRHDLKDPEVFSAGIILNSISVDDERAFLREEALQVLHEGLAFIRSQPVGRQRQISHIADALYLIPLSVTGMDDRSLENLRDQVGAARSQLNGAGARFRNLRNTRGRYSPSMGIIAILICVSGFDAGQAFLNQRLMYAGVAGFISLCLVGVLVMSIWRGKRERVEGKSAS
ncbi:hypothetical protein [Pseudomonas sp. PDM25]|uniref:hypothetical protein n=1 Tax=Pseudomonas sp. PDM25 TaxID=2854772 RepID=UPI001C47CF94|nr:hypothetical protein [Pseudomonas sp. PDM25]MBV7515645.1 hypothetical protein [Pseudomonas sp. PDM25]